MQKFIGFLMERRRQGRESKEQSKNGTQVGTERFARGLGLRLLRTYAANTGS